MKRLRSVWSFALIAAVAASAFLFSTAGDLRAEEVEVQVWDGSSPQAGVADSLCDMTQMQTLLNEDEKVRVCTVNAVTKSEPARKLVMKNMLSSNPIREMIMNAIVSTPALRKMMEAKLAASK